MKRKYVRVVSPKIWGGVLSLLFILSLGSNFSCSPVKFKAKSTNSTNYPPDDGTALWRSGAWSTCSQACNGTQTRSVICVNQDNKTVPDSYCKEARPATTQSCNTNSSSCTSGNPTWSVGSWSACSPACGSGTQTRTVECRSSTGVVADSLCTEAKPATQQSCNTTCNCTPVSKTKQGTVSSGSNKVDILLVIDDSTSMAEDNAKLAQRLSGFVSSLQSNNLDWQMCVTTTDVKYYGGRPLQWSTTSSYVINPSTANLSTVFNQTIADIGSGYSNDEQGIKASIYSIYNNTLFPCYRSDAAYASIIISDEDERSVGGNCSLSSQQCYALDFYNQPSTLPSLINATWGSNKRYAVNSIVVQDSTCKAQEDAQGSKSFIGTKYIDLSSRTEGVVGNICDANYAQNLKYFQQTLVQTISSIQLDCAPTAAPTVTLPSGYNWTISGSTISVTPAMTPGVSYSVNYQCCP